MDTVTATEVHVKTTGETVPIAINYEPKLDSGETLSGTPTVTASSSALTISSVAISTGSLTISGRTVAASQAITCLAAAGTAGVTYTLTAKANTSGGGLNREVRCTLKVIA